MKKNRVLWNKTLLYILENEELYRKNDMHTYIHNLKIIKTKEIQRNDEIMTYLNKKRAQNMILEHLNNSKTLSNIKINNDDINNNIKEDLIITDNKEEKENENGFINTIYNKNLNNLITIIYVYFYILIPFLISYFIDLFFYLSNEGNINEERNDNITNNNNTNYMNNTNNEFNKTEIYNNTCIFSSNSDSNKFNFINLIICFGFFCLRDIFPYLMIYLMFFYYKKKNYHRPSF